MPKDPSKSFGKSLRIAVLAPWADFSAPAEGIPRGVRPFNFGMITHLQPALEFYLEKNMGAPPFNPVIAKWGPSSSGSPAKGSFALYSPFVKSVRGISDFLSSFITITACDNFSLDKDYCHMLPLKATAGGRTC